MYGYLVGRVVVLLEVDVGQGLLHRDPLVGVEGQHAVQQVQGWEKHIGICTFM